MISYQITIHSCPPLLWKWRNHRLDSLSGMDVEWMRYHQRVDAETRYLHKKEVFLLGTLSILGSGLQNIPLYDIEYISTPVGIAWSNYYLYSYLYVISDTESPSVLPSELRMPITVLQYNKALASGCRSSPPSRRYQGKRTYSYVLLTAQRIEHCSYILPYFIAISPRAIICYQPSPIPLCINYYHSPLLSREL